MSPLLEAAMLGDFSISWYCSIWKMLRTRQASGKSLGVVLLICFGYICGITSKLALYRETGVWSELILHYIWNLVVTGFDAWLVVQFTREAPVYRPLARNRPRQSTPVSQQRASWVS
jgi:ABC-type spermidine/putrescine transport system permease subunit II